MKQVSVIGMGMCDKDLTESHLKLIQQADILVAGKRHLEFFKDFSGIKKEITKDIKGIIEYIKNKMPDYKISVLASGDPLFFGIGSLLVKCLGQDNICIYPNITSISAAFSRIKESWNNAHIISIHGRFNEPALLDALLTKDKIALLTDLEKTPSWLAKFLIKKGFTNFSMCVLEQLGTDYEKVQWYKLNQAQNKKFANPNVVILSRIFDQQPELKMYPGMPDDWYTHENGLITKAEVRALTLSKLKLCSPYHILWDLGAGSGSISIESSIFIKTGKIFAVEKNPERIKQIQMNKDFFMVNNLEIIHADLPGGLDNLPAPDRIFIGGGGKNLGKIIKSAAKYLNAEGIMVVNTVLLQNIEPVLNTFNKLGFQTEIVQVQINSGKNMPWGQRLQAQNPVWIITGVSNKK